VFVLAANTAMLAGKHLLRNPGIPVEIVIKYLRY
jgi:hypothetical protein